jgi:hypothetical protein
MSECVFLRRYPTKQAADRFQKLLKSVDSPPELNLSYCDDKLWVSVPYHLDRPEVLSANLERLWQIASS